MNKIIKKRETEQDIIKTLEKMQKLVYTAETAKVFNDVKDKDIVLFVGNTRCGKSTIVNFVIGNQLIANKIRVTKYNITKLDADSPGPNIGTGSTSETSIPSAWLSSKISGLVVDAPGFNDNRGEAQDVANSFYIKQIIRSAKSVKLALICDIKDITDDSIEPFISFVDKILTIFPHDGNLHKGMTLLLTKDNENYSKEDIPEILKTKIMDEPNLSIKNRKLVKFFYENLNRIVLIKMPNKTGIIEGPEIFNGLIETIENDTMRISNKEMREVSPGISDKSRIFLLKARNHFTESGDFDDVLQIVFQEYSKMLTEYDIPVDSNPTRETMVDLKQKLKLLVDQVSSIGKNQSTLVEKLTQLSSLVPNVYQLKEDSYLYLKMKFVSFVDDILKIRQSVIFNIKIDAVISHMVNITHLTRWKLQEKMNEVSQAEVNKKIKQLIEQQERSSEESNRRMRKLEEKDTEKILQDLVINTVVDLVTAASPLIGIVINSLT